MHNPFVRYKHKPRPQASPRSWFCLCFGWIFQRPWIIHTLPMKSDYSFKRQYVETKQIQLFAVASDRKKNLIINVIVKIILLDVYLWNYSFDLSFLVIHQKFFLINNSNIQQISSLWFITAQKLMTWYPINEILI